MDTIKPCFVCGTKDTTIQQFTNLIENKDKYKCGCMKCGTFSIRNTKEEAIQAWNSRID